MSAQFGRWNFDGKPVADNYLQRVRSIMASCGRDSSTRYKKENVGILYQAFHTTRESRNETQPTVLASGAVLTWDGRLDNREELIRELPYRLPADSPDVSIVAAAYGEWHTCSFAKLTGDWALALWNPVDRSLLLARDFVGTRHLYYCLDRDQITWSTILDPLVLAAGHSFAIEEEYIAGWLSSLPATHLTPYAGIKSVPPSSFIRITSKTALTTRYWDFDPKKRIRYRQDPEYEEHFRTVFFESVRRRLRSDQPVLAELSGGMDSSSIVCVADAIRAQHHAIAPRLDTVSYYDDSEPDWNERPYFTEIEKNRSQAGCHIDVSRDDLLDWQSVSNELALTPASLGQSTDAGRELACCMQSRGNRVLLSGFGGDEMTGGMPNPTPEIQDLLATANMGRLAVQLKRWAMYKKCPWHLVLWKAVRGFLPHRRERLQKLQKMFPWLHSAFVQRHRFELSQGESTIAPYGSLPSFQQNQSLLEGVRRVMASQTAPSDCRFEKRYPFLDRDFLAFMFSVPREQVVRPGYRRCLMRRSLARLVPEKVLRRERKAFVIRALMPTSADLARLAMMSREQWIAASMKVIDTVALNHATDFAHEIHAIIAPELLRTLALELWLRGITTSDLVIPSPDICRDSKNSSSCFWRTLVSKASAS